jgi:hypothetical protein
MTRTELEHIIRAAAAITNSREIMVVGSQSILGALPDAPEELRESMEADVYALHAPETSDVIEGAIGEGSPFQVRYGAASKLAAGREKDKTFVSTMLRARGRVGALPQQRPGWRGEAPRRTSRSSRLRPRWCRTSSPTGTRFAGSSAPAPRAPRTA